MSGRPRDPRVDEAVTHHLVELLARSGPDGFTVDELAARSGVGKAAIYRRYRTRDELIAAGFASVNTDMPDVAGLPVREALVRLLEWGARAHATGMTPTWLIGMQKFPEVKQLYASKVSEPRRAALREILVRGQAEGLLREDADLDVAMACLSAPAIVIGMHRARGSQEGVVAIEKVVDLVLDGLLSPVARASGS